MATHIACRLTAPLPSAIATIAVRGNDCHRIIASIMNCNDTDDFWPVNRIRFLKWPISTELSEHVVVCRIASDQVEIHCHGGVAVTDAILSTLGAAGCEVVESEIYSDPLPQQSARAKFVHLCNQALLQTRSDRAAGILLDQIHGKQLECLSSIRTLVESKCWPDSRVAIDRLSRWFDLGQHLVKPWQVVLAGPPNVGKSSLINALAGQAVSIVHHEAGTTRDWIETETMIDGWPVVLTDTAGIRETDHRIEAEGVKRAQEQIAAADLVILVVDSSIGWTSQHDQIVSSIDSKSSNHIRRLTAWNKCDLIEQSIPRTSTNLNCPSVACSSKESIEPLIAAISQALVPEPPEAGEVVIFDPNMQILLTEIGSRLTTEIDSTVESELQLLVKQLWT